jgi:ribosome-binding factor A
MRRSERLAEVLREEIMEIVGYELEDPRVFGVSVTEVIVSENLRDAKIFVMVEGSEAEIKQAMTALQHAASYIRRQIALNLNLHHAPHLHFARDTVEENASRIERLLSEIATKK